MSNLAFVDTETTGLDPDQHEIWEVGLIVNGDEWLWHLPVDLGRADAMALKIGRYHDRFGNESQMADKPYTELAVFAEWFGRLTRGRHLVGAVISFDEERLRKLLRDNGACPEWHYHLVDVEALAAGWLAAIRRDAADLDWRGDPGSEHCRNMELAGPPWDSNALSLAIGIDPGDFERHTALGDARWAMAIYDAVMGQR